MPSAAVLAVEVGCDGVLICSGDHVTQMSALEALVYAIEGGRLAATRVEDALKRQSRAKEWILAASVGPRPPQGRALQQLLGRDEHRAIADEMARFV